VNGTKKAIALLLVILAAGALIAFFRSGISLETVIAYAQRLRNVWWAPLAYFAAYAILNVLFIPTQLLSIAATVIWGWRVGATIELFAATFGAMFPYFIARIFRVERALEYQDTIEREGFTFLLIMRLVPILPYTALNYAAGITPIRALPYAFATFLGMIPSTFIFAFFVDSIVQGVLKPREVFIRIVVAGLLLAALVILTRLAASRLRPEGGRRDRAAGPQPGAGPRPE
jgi:uncharacterized membrane protein YdjX (TVP38/TMEM64 family)